MAILKAAYPAYYAKISKEEAIVAVNLWADLFAAEDALLVAAAVKALIASKVDSYPPSIGAVKEKILQLTCPQEKVPMSDITYRDTLNYINILYKDNGRKWICRLVLNDGQKSILIPDENKVPVKHTITDIYDIRNFKSELENVLERYID